ncbi:Thiol-disulfide oxidoreductase ResA [subsurface metagenome]
MVRMLKVSVVIALAAILVMGLVTVSCCDGVDPNGGNPNGDAPNGHVPNEGEPDLVSGPGIIIDCDKYDGQRFQDRDPAPDFRFQDAAGQTFSLSDFRGKSVMLNFWRTTCGYCILEMPYIQQVYDDWQGGEVVILTIDIGERADKVNDLLDELGFSLPVLLDIEAAAMAQYRVTNLPRTFFIDKEGLIRGIKFGAFQSAEEIEDILNRLIAL